MPLGRTLRRGAAFVAAVAVVAAVTFAVASTDGGDCEPAEPSHPSVARAWNEAVLDAIRGDLPAPTVHARNLFHVSTAMWDAWAAYDPGARAVYADEQAEADDVERARRVAIGYAAHRVATARYADSVGAEASLARFDALLADACLPIDGVGRDGGGAAAVGTRIGQAVLDATVDDGAREADGYDDGDYEPVNPPLVVAEPGTEMVDPNRWQPLQLAEMISQNGIPVSDGVQEFIDPHWGHVEPFAIEPAGDDGLPIDPGPPPRLGDAAFAAAVVDVIAASAALDPADDETVDISPRQRGDNRLGADDGDGRTTNPVTGRPYASVEVPRGDFGRVVAEFWADGPESETPPGHWNTIANEVSDTLDRQGELRLAGDGEPLDRLEWDVKLGLALNGAVHDAAIAAWGAKNRYDYVRPISMIRHMGGLGQSSDRDGPAFDPDGLPLVDGLVEVVTAASSAAGARHAALAEHVGEVAVRGWTPGDGVVWHRAVEWVPYQQDTFVSPAFAAYVSGHSAFSRAAAEVLAAATGSDFFPGGLGTWTIPADSLRFDDGPARGFSLQWATYADAADQAGRSRIWGGIHVTADDLAGRLIGADCGVAAWQQAQQYFGEPPG